MYLSAKRIAKFKKSLPSILCIAVAQTGVCFSFPPYLRMEEPFNIITPAVVSIIGFIAIVNVFVFTDKMAKFYKLDGLHENTYKSKSAKLRLMAMLIGIAIGMFF